MSGIEVITKLIDAMNRHDVGAVQACYAPDARIFYPPREPRLPEKYAADEKTMLSGVPDYHIEPLSILEAEGGHVVLELRMSGTQRESLGGHHFVITGAYIFQIANGLIVEERAYPDMAGLKRQLNLK